MLNPEVNINPLLAGRKIDQEFLSRLAIQRDYYQEAADKEPTKLITDSDLPAMPFSKRDLPPDPRLKGAQGGPQPLHVMLADIIHTSLNGMKRRFIVYRDTAIALFAESQDMKKFPEWLMKDPRKMNERSIRINEVIAMPEPTGKWLGELDDKTYDTLVYFLFLNRSK